MVVLTMHLYSLIFALVLCITEITSQGLITPCKLTDQECMDASANAVYQQIVDGIPELGIEPRDPLYEELFEGDTSGLKYKLFNTEIKGFKQCNLSETSLDLDSLKYHVQLFCPYLDMEGKYELGGALFAIPVEGKGEYSIISGNYKVNVDGEVKKVQGSGKNYLSIKNYQVKAYPLTPIKFDFKNLFNGQKDLADTILRFANENWMQVANIVQDPLWYAHTKFFVTAANKIMKTVSLEDLTIK